MAGGYVVADLVEVGGVGIKGGSGVVSSEFNQHTIRKKIVGSEGKEKEGK